MVLSFLYLLARRVLELVVLALRWQTAKDNYRAQRVYERVGGRRQEWIDYSLGTSERESS